jgi:hypothetical protein
VYMYVFKYALMSLCVCIYQDTVDMGRFIIDDFVRMHVCMYACMCARVFVSGHCRYAQV